MMDIDEITKAVEERATRRLLLLVGFDGVLVNYEGDPAHVRLSAERCDALNTLADRPGIVLGIVSGRRVRDLRQCVSLDAGPTGRSARGSWESCDRIAAECAGATFARARKETAGR